MSLYIVIIDGPDGPQLSSLFCFLSDAEEVAAELAQTSGVKTTVKSVGFAPCFIGGQFMDGVVTRYNKETEERRNIMSRSSDLQDQAAKEGHDLQICFPFEALPCEAEMRRWWNKEEEEEQRTEPNEKEYSLWTRVMGKIFG